MDEEMKPRVATAPDLDGLTTNLTAAFATDPLLELGVPGPRGDRRAALQVA
jgi:hypothetical protein